jgi:hypothetical protein
MIKLVHVLALVAGVGMFACGSLGEEEIAEDRAEPEVRASAKASVQAVAARGDDPAAADQMHVAATRRASVTQAPAGPGAEPTVVMSMIRIRSEQNLRTTVNRMRDELREHDLEVAAAGTLDGEKPIHLFVVKPPREDWATLTKAPHRALQLSTVLMVYEAEPGKTTLAFIDRDGRRSEASAPDGQARAPGATPMTETQIHARNIRLALERAAGGSENAPAP